jgi:mannose-6-phosphate isomerase
MDLLSAPIQPYKWGSRFIIAELQGRRAPTDSPEAELWMGAHPSAPASLCRDGVSVALDAVIARNPQREIGPGALGMFGARLPFLMKVLAVERALSLQVHPDRAQAREGYRAERLAAAGARLATPNYVDDWLKPELILALTPFELFAGFRSPDELLQFFDRLGPGLMGPLIPLLVQRPPDDALIAALRCVLSWSPEQRHSFIADVLASCARLATDDPDYGPACAAALRLADDYPDDLGVVASLLLRHRVLAPGEVLFIPSGALHAYVKGACVEVQANSDNVMRGGLTAKKIDILEFLKITSPRAEVRVVPPVSMTGGTECFDSGAPEVRVYRVHAGPDRAELPGDGARIALCIEGKVTLSDPYDRTLELQRGDSCFIAAAEDRVAARSADTSVLILVTSGRVTSEAHEPVADQAGRSSSGG